MSKDELPEDGFHVVKVPTALRDFLDNQRTVVQVIHDSPFGEPVLSFLGSEAVWKFTSPTRIHAEGAREQRIEFLGRIDLKEF